ncbi:MAG: F0F1 ATP synthase subunit gamma [Rhizobiales bacterium]|nr:F0F1 ATP synthase subunit gamma [Hyphomicrobiales bacterium]
MASLKDLKNRIASVTSTQKITRAMQMVASAKLRRAREAAEAARPYAERMGAVLSSLAAAYKDVAGAPQLLSGNGSDQRHLLIVTTAERGLCGAFNSNIAKMARAHALELLGQGKDVKIFYVGKKGFEALKRQFENNYLDKVLVEKLTYDIADQVGNRVLDMFAANEFDVCSLFYSRFENVLTQTPTRLSLIPAEFDETPSDESTASASYEYEPSQESILETLLPTNLKVQIFTALLENGAGEMGSKMTAMDSATRNAGDMIDRLTLSYNRQRQAQITKELIEIISGAEAL